MKRKWIVELLVFCSCACGALAGTMTATITGIGSGSLDGISFTDQMFSWAITYDTTVFTTEPFGTDVPIFLNPVSVITLQDEVNPIGITQEHGLWVDTSGAGFSCGTIKMTGLVEGDDILDVDGTLFWDGVSIFEFSSINSGFFDQFVDITTDRGLLTMDSGTVSSFTAAVPEPASVMMIGLGGLLIAGYRRFQGCV